VNQNGEELATEMNVFGCICSQITYMIYQINGIRGQSLQWKELKENFIKAFEFKIEEVDLKDTIQKLKNLSEKNQLIIKPYLIIQPLVTT